MSFRSVRDASGKRPRRLMRAQTPALGSDGSGRPVEATGDDALDLLVARYGQGSGGRCRRVEHRHGADLHRVASSHAAAARAASIVGSGVVIRTVGRRVGVVARGEHLRGMTVVMIPGLDYPMRVPHRRSRPRHGDREDRHGHRKQDSDDGGHQPQGNAPVSQTRICVTNGRLRQDGRCGGRHGSAPRTRRSDRVGPARAGVGAMGVAAFAGCSRYFENS